MGRAVIPSEPAELLALLRREESLRRLNTKTIRAIAWGTLLFLIVAKAITWARSGTPPDILSSVPALLLLGAASGVSANHRRAAEVAAKLESPEFVPAMVEVLDCGEDETRALAVASLRRSLPLLSAGNVPNLDERQQSLLAAEAARYDDVDFGELCLTTLGRFGGPRVLVELDQIAQGGHVAKGPASDRLVVAARMAAAEIRMRTAKSVVDSKVRSVEESASEETQRLRLGS